VTEDRVRAVLENRIEGRDLGFLGEPRINVLEANLTLDQQFGRPHLAGPAAATGTR
jgi:K+-transporting ATPase ATPase C chain